MSVDNGSNGLLIVLSGPSGVGKGTVRDELFRVNDNIIYSVSITTRQPRKGETDGKDYFFSSKNNFFKMIENNELLEWAEVYGNYYGTPRQFVEKNLENGKDVILELDIQGALQVQDSFPEGVFIFLLPPSISELKERIKRRGTEAKEDLDKRLGAAKEEIYIAREYHYVIVNKEVNSSASTINSIIQAEKCKFNRYGEELIKEVIKK
ncbi:guanylate kinase [Natranaerofaba carboxydovora]|uniref:guanylate kinase n=1 Tax=Natranaerofaba carboxydovora TaxID=2742683 RepID=UPI001F13595A|nr:guanylate kinase [Natranaerofaba carboxydovora]UMZ73292.1 Guanylate kinase [Natranaerofaba carboxydovora]